MFFRSVHQIQVHSVSVRFEVSHDGCWNMIKISVSESYDIVLTGGMNVFKIILKVYDITLQAQNQRKCCAYYTGYKTLRRHHYFTFYLRTQKQLKRSLESGRLGNRMWSASAGLAEEKVIQESVQSAVLVSLLVALPASVTTSENRNEMPKFVHSPSGDSLKDQSIIKRTVSFSSCTGVYDRELLVSLDRVCEDCYNLYRDVGVAAECRSNCFHNEVFLYCVVYMFRPRQRNQYRAALQRLGK
ncbi:uncharacterized protein LOC134787591 [Penaeus indicus]|uniref:uncharacterized protein LOC134787591 n=1 Tax=Penaeus indicus TaxID=29960 RepID=UPI00300C490B